jgi:hypothetical protein
MGHVRLGALPRTRRWQEVIHLIAAGAEPDQVAGAALTAAEKALAHAYDDTGLTEAVYLLSELPLAAKEGEFTKALRVRGLDVSDNPSLAEIIGAVSDVIDKRIGRNGHRTDLGEMAQMACVETLSQVVGERTTQLFGATTGDIQRELGKLATKAQFSKFARQFFCRLTNRLLDYFVSRTLSDHVGAAQRFTTLSQKQEFSAALERHCEEASRVVEEFSGGWFSKTNWEKEGIDRESARKFAGYAMKKLTSELQAGARGVEDVD